MKKLLVVLAVVGLVVCRPVLAQEMEPASGTLIPPPAIYIPHGGTIVTEINVSDDDVLGIVKQVLPVAADAAREIVGDLMERGLDQGAGRRMGVPLALVAELDVEGLLEAVGGIQRVRVIVARYGRKIDAATFMNEFDAGVAKAGTFSKVLGDMEGVPGAVGIYAAPGNESYIGFVYDSRQRELYAMRIVGFVDVPALTQWVAKAVKLFLTGGDMDRMEAPTAEPQETPEGMPAEPPMPDQQ